MENLDKVAIIIDELDKLYTENSRLTWVQYTTGFDFGIEKNYEEIQEFCKDKSRFEIIKEHKKLELILEDRRCIEIVYNHFEPFHLSDELNALKLEIEKKTNELSKILNTHRSIFEGKEISSAEITQILYTEENRERRKAAFLSRSTVNEALVKGGFVELLKLRNQYAKLAGSKDFVDYQLKNDELDSSLFSTWKEDLKSILPKIKEKRSSFAKKYLNDDHIMPWDEFYINAKIAPSLNTKVDMSQFYTIISQFISKFGIDITKYNITYDIFSRAQKSEWGYNFTIQTGRDSRILANVKNMFNEYNVLLHETGHAIHSFNLDPENKILNMGVSGIISEGIANLFGSFVFNKAFYEALLPNSDDVQKEFNDLKEYKSLTSMLSIHNILFDQELYRTNIESLEDINNLYWDKYKELLDETPYAAEPTWGFRIHHTTHPIYLHNYFMGDVTCEMLEKVFKQRYNASSIMDKPKEFGEFLINNVIKESGMYKYQELYNKISGEEFSLKAYID
jgi:oligoendopeptidase F